MCNIEVMDLNNTINNWTGGVVNSSTENGKQMVGLWEARFVHYRIILIKLNVYFLPALICIGKHISSCSLHCSLTKRDVKVVLSLNERRLQTWVFFDQPYIRTNILDSPNILRHEEIGEWRGVCHAVELRK